MRFSLKNSVQNQVLKCSSGTRGPCLAVLKTHALSFTWCRRNRLFIATWTSYFFKDDRPLQRASRQEWESWIIWPFLTIRSHKCHSYCWHLNAIEFLVNTIGNSLC